MFSLRQRHGCLPRQRFWLECRLFCSDSYLKGLVPNQVLLRLSLIQDRVSSGTLAIFAAIRRASSLLSSLAARIVHSFPKKYTHFAQNGHKQINKNCKYRGRTKRDGAGGALAHDPSDRVNNGGTYGILAYD